MFRDRIVVITGGSRGIGLATARAFLDEGARVVLLAKSAANLNAAARTLSHSALRTYVCDLTDERAIARTFARLTKEVGPLDILINNAGVTLTGDLKRHDEAALRHLLSVNLRAPLLCMREAFRVMKRRRRGIILNVSSNVAGRPLPLLAAYSSSKAALNALTFSLRQETLPFGISIAIVEPGAVATDMAKGLAPEFRRRFTGGIRALSADDVARSLVDACRIAKRSNLKSLTIEHFPT